MKFNSIIVLLVLINGTFGQEYFERSRASANLKGRSLANSMFSYNQPETKDFLQLQVI